MIDHSMASLIDLEIKVLWISFFFVQLPSKPSRQAGRRLAPLTKPLSDHPPHTLDALRLCNYETNYTCNSKS